MRFPNGAYRCVVIDPPWDIALGPALRRRSGPWTQRLPYDTMADDEIAGLPVAGLLADDVWVVLWVVESKIEVAPALVRGWGCSPRGWRVWRKCGGIQWPGGWRHDAEFMLVASRGRPMWRSTKGMRAVVDAPRPRVPATSERYREYEARCRASGATCPPPLYEHSAKPAEVYDDLAARTDPPRIDLFARRRHPGFEAWGDEVAA